MKTQNANPQPVSRAPVTPASAAPGSSAANQAAGSPNQKPQTESTSWSKPTKYLVGIGLFLVFIFLIYISRSVLPLIIMSALIAFIVRPIILGLTKRFKMKKGSAVALTYFLVGVALILLPLVLIPAMLDSFNFLIAIDYKALAENILTWFNQITTSIHSQPVLNMVLGAPLTTISETLNNLFAGQSTTTPLNLNLTFDTVSKSLAKTLGTLTSVVGPLVSAAVSIIFTLLISMQLASSWDDLFMSVPNLFPPAYKKELGELSDGIARTWNAFLRGQLTLMLAVGLVTWVGAILLGAPQPFLLALVAGIFELIPSIGPFLAGFVGVTLSLLFGSSYLPVNNLIFALIVLGFYVLVQLLENQILVPYIMGDAMDLPPAVVLIGVVVFGSAFGLLGVFLATPIIATGRLIFNYLHAKILEPPLAPPEPEPESSIWNQIKGFGSSFGKLFKKPAAQKPKAEVIPKLPENR